tara:strand:+ start:2462 stop:3034 length:573 start_codon:yes stop_codon:yes gene_type:complete
MMILKDTGNGCISTFYAIEDDYKNYYAIEDDYQRIYAMEEGEEKDALTEPLKNRAYEERKANLQANEILAPEVLPTEDPLFWYIENGELKVHLPEAIEAEEAERQEVLKKEALEYQRAQQSENELGILHGYSVSDLATKPKALAQIQWMTSLFKVQKLRAEDITNETQFESVGNKPYSFTELYDEKFGEL